jgi:hypothetical protein
MASFSADSINLAALAAVSLAELLDTLAADLFLPDPPGGQIRSDADLVATLLAPALRDAADVATIGALIASDAILIGKATAPNSDDESAPSARDAANGFYTAATGTLSALPRIVSPGRLRAAGLAQALCAVAEASFLGQAFLAEAQSEFADRQSAEEARQRIADAMDAARDRIAQAIGGEVLAILSEAAHQATAHIVALTADLRPTVLVTASRSYPSTALAYALYGDPSRGGGLVTRNRSGTPLFMPASFEALAPDPS